MGTPTRWLLAATLLLPAAAVYAQDAAPTEITAKDWSYQAIEDLARRGLVHGYQDAKFLDGRKLSRFEMATLVKRVIDSLMDVPVPSKAGPVVAQTPGTAAGRGQGVEAPPLGRSIASGKLARTASFTESDLGTVKRLADTYSVELAVIGVNLQETMDKVAGLEGRVESIESSLRDPEGPLQTVINNVARIDKIRLSGYIQARYQSFENASEAANPGGPGVAVRGPATDGFTLRRVRFTLAARPTDKIGARIQLDAAGAAVATRDAWVDYFFSGNPATGYTATLGQMKYPFGFEVVQSSSVREAPERARVTNFFFPGERDRGFKIASATGGKFFYEVGAFNGGVMGSRVGTNTDDNNNDKNIVGRVRTSIGKRLDVGVSFDYGKTLRVAGFPGEAGIAAATPREDTKFVLGADLQWFPLDGTVIRAEWMGGQALRSRANGYILQLIQNVGKKNQLVLKYDWFGIDDPRPVPLNPIATPNPATNVGLYSGTLSTMAIGVIHHLDSSTRLKLFYEIHERGKSSAFTGAGAAVNPFAWLGNVLRFEVITLF